MMVVVVEREIPLSPHTIPEFKGIRRNYYCFLTVKSEIDDQAMAEEGGDEV